jgi:hypothetical protein
MFTTHSPVMGAGRRRPRLTILTLLALTLSIGGAGMASAQPPAPAVVVLTADAATRAGLAIPIELGTFMGDAVVQVTLGSSGAGSESARRTALRVMSVAPGGSAVAIADRIDDPAGGLTIAHPDGSQVRTALPGVTGAVFAPDGAWLAAVDGRGRIWRVDSQSGSASRLADGPFAGAVTFEQSGAVVAIAVASVEAPYSSRLVRIDPQDGRLADVAGIDAPLVLAAQPLTDGSLAAVIHPLGGGIAVRRVTHLGSAPLTDIGPSAADVAVSPDGDFVAYAVANDGVYLIDVRRGVTARLGDGDLPRFAPNARALLVQASGGRTIVIGFDGRTIQTHNSPTVAWATCVRGCRP